MTERGAITVSGQRIAAVTGAAGGIGSAICRRLAADGFAVACLDARVGDARQLAAELPGAVGLGMDVSDAVSVRSAAAGVRAELGGARRTAPRRAG